MKISKKVLTMVLAGVLAIGMTAPVYADDGGPLASTTETAKTKTAYDSPTTLEVDALVSSLDTSGAISYTITWGSLTYTYSFGSWNAGTHTFTPGAWSAGVNTLDGQISVKNDSYTPIHGNATFAKAIGLTGYDSVTGTITSGSGDINTDSSLVATLAIEGAPDTTAATGRSTQIGTVTVTISSTGD